MNSQEKTVMLLKDLQVRRNHIHSHMPTCTSDIDKKRYYIPGVKGIYRISESLKPISDNKAWH